MAFEDFVQEDTMRRGPWIEEEDERLVTFVNLMGERRWDSIARVSGLRRSGKSCRLRWLNYLRPDLKHGQMSAEEESVILELQGRWGNKWSKIARRLPGRTDNEIKNYWRTYLRKKSQAQEQEKLRREVEKMMNTPDDQSTQTSNSPLLEEMLITTENYDLGSSDYAFPTSPYENRICNWITETVHDQSGLKHPHILDAWLSDPAWPSGDGDCWTDLLWDMEKSS